MGLTVKLMIVVSLPAQLKASCTDGTLKKGIQDKVMATKDKSVAKARQLLTQVTEKSAPQVTALTQTALFKKAAQMVVLGSEKTLGKEKATAILTKAGTYIPAAWKAAPSPAKTEKAK